MRKIFTFLILFCASTCLYAQDSKTLVPKISGLLKTRFEVDTENGDMRFNVNNARLGFGGYYGTSTNNFKYFLQAELNAEGKLSMLDTYGAYTYGSFEVSLGQQLCRFGTELNRGPKLNYFASSSFLTTYVGSYYKTASAGETDSKPAYKSLGARDMGAMFTYRNKTKVPINLMVGILNGSGVNNPVWRNSVNFMARAWVDCNTVLDGFGVAASYYTGTTLFDSKITMAGGELRYIKNRWIVEGEYASRWLNLSSGTDRLDLAAVHAIYRQPVDWGVIKFVAPMARWDYGHNMTVLATASELTKFDSQRATAGLTFGFAEQLLKCELRLNYEHYFFHDKPAAIADDPQFQNKFILEFFLVF